MAACLTLFNGSTNQRRRRKETNYWEQRAIIYRTSNHNKQSFRYIDAIFLVSFFYLKLDPNERFREPEYYGI